MNDVFLENTLGPLLVILVFAIIGTPIALMLSFSRRESFKANMKRCFRVIIEFIKKILQGM